MAQNDTLNRVTLPERKPITSSSRLPTVHLDSCAFEEGSLRPIQKCNATLELGAAGEVKRLLQQEIDLPRRAESKVA